MSRNLVAEQSVVQKLNGTSTCSQRSTTCSNYEITIRDTSSDDDDDDEHLAKAHKHVPSWAQEKQLEMAFVAQMRTADPARIFAECRISEDSFSRSANINESIHAFDEFEQRPDTTPPSVEACCLKAVVVNGSAEKENVVCDEGSIIPDDSISCEDELVSIDDGSQRMVKGR
uniref:INCENP_ARK-bind domain-containing protein n=1 Tax=Trichuris muris TaxID=70415 RepID=A0A5S6R3K6_TRIMR